MFEIHSKFASFDPAKPNRAILVIADSEPLPGWVERNCFDESELARRDRTTHPRAKFQFTRGRLILRNVLGKWMGLAPKGVPIRLSADGKPVLDSPYDTFHFNVSNTEGFIAFVFSNTPVGIDVECHRPGRDLPGLVKRYFAPNEVKQFESLPLELRDAAFLRGWTCKEALLKGIGCGVRELANCEVELDPRLPPRAKKLPREAGEREWELHCWTVCEGVEAAVARITSLPSAPPASASRPRGT